MIYLTFYNNFRIPTILFLTPGRFIPAGFENTPGFNLITLVIIISVKLNQLKVCNSLI